MAALWKGNGITVIHRLPYSALNFWAYERLTELWRQHVPAEKSNPTLDCSRRLAAGGLAGGFACAVVTSLIQEKILSISFLIQQRVYDFGGLSLAQIAYLDLVFAALSKILPILRLQQSSKNLQL